ncbi:MAG TPA: translation elongation factor Ts [Candidatus Paceibacterota bacterium]|nr:translation elongation factor Ts [Candidatus Paceibacterota bacterium]
MAITTEQVKELRDKTGVSVMQCRKALEESAGDMEKALIMLRKKGAEIAEKKSDRSAADGVIVVRTDTTRALTLILNCETDFVAKNADFTTLANTLADIAWNDGAEKARQQAPALINDVVLKIGENIQLGTIDEVRGDVVGAYVHHTGKVAAVVALKGGTPDVAKDIAMHVAAMKPAYRSSADITEEAKDAVVEVLKKEVDESGKPEDIKAKMLEGKLAGYFKEQTLLDQPFFKNPDVTIETYAANNGATVDKFVLYTLTS